MERNCFVHVPKTGGSTLISALRSSLNGAIFHANEMRSRQIPLQFLLDRYPVVAGHFTFAQISPSVLENTFVFTLLREPVDRAISLYCFYREQAARGGLDARVAMAKALDLPSFVERLTDRVGPWSNWQTFVFSGASHCEQPAHELLPAALCNLERMALVGVQDDLDAVIRRVSELRGWPLRSPCVRVNVTQHRLLLHQIDSSIVHRLSQLNECDTQLFARARQLWEQSKTRAPAGASAMPRVWSEPKWSVASEQGTKEILFTDIRIVAEGSATPEEIRVGDCVSIRLRGRSRITADDIAVGIRICDDLGMEVYGVNTRLLDIDIPIRAGQEFGVTFSFDMHLAPGLYHLTAAIHDATDHLHKCYHWIDNVVDFECRQRGALTFSGVTNLRATATLDLN